MLDRVILRIGYNGVGVVVTWLLLFVVIFEESMSGMGIAFFMLGLLYYICNVALLCISVKRVLHE